MITVSEAIKTIAQAVPAPGSDQVETTPIADAVGRVLAGDVRSDSDLPPFTRSTMDGFALRSCDVSGPGVRLDVVGEAAAGVACDVAIGEGQAIRIFTGAVMPQGADAVVMVEKTRVEGSSVILEDEVPSGKNVASQGEDLKCGEVVLDCGSEVRAMDIGLLASVGGHQVPTYRRPGVAILATGSELVSPDTPPRAGMVRESNGVALAGLVRAYGGEAVLLDSARDDPQVIKDRSEVGMDHDIFLLTGGSSVGDFDFTPQVLKELGVETLFERVALKPGKPTLFGMKGDTAVFGLPGNPVSAVVAFHLFVRTALRRRGGYLNAAPTRVRARLRHGVQRNPKRELFLPVLLSLHDGEATASFAGWHGSGDLTCFQETNGLLSIPMGEGEEKAGSLVEVLITAGEVGSAPASES